MQDVLGYWKDVRGKFLAEPLGEQGLEARTIYLQKELCQSAHPILLGHKNFWPLTCPKEGSPLLRFLQTPESSKGKLFTALGQPNPQMPCHRIQSRIGQGSPLAHSNDQAKRNSQMKNDKENEKKKHTLLPLHYFRFIYDHLCGGFNPVENYARQIGSFPQIFESSKMVLRFHRWPNTGRLFPSDLAA